VPCLRGEVSPGAVAMQQSTGQQGKALAASASGKWGGGGRGANERPGHEAAESAVYKTMG